MCWALGAHQTQYVILFDAAQGRISPPTILHNSLLCRVFLFSGHTFLYFSSLFSISFKKPQKRNNGRIGGIVKISFYSVYILLLEKKRYAKEKSRIDPVRWLFSIGSRLSSSQQQIIQIFVFVRLYSRERSVYSVQLSISFRVLFYAMQHAVVVLSSSKQVGWWDEVDDWESHLFSCMENCLVVVAFVCFWK